MLRFTSQFKTTPPPPTCHRSTDEGVSWSSSVEMGGVRAGEIELERLLLTTPARNLDHKLPTTTSKTSKMGKEASSTQGGTEDLRLNRRLSVKIPVDQHQRSHQGPNVEGDADPAGADLHPHRGPPAAHGLVAGVGAAGTQQHAGSETGEGAQTHPRRHLRRVALQRFQRSSCHSLPLTSTTSRQPGDRLTEGFRNASLYVQRQRL